MRSDRAAVFAIGLPAGDVLAMAGMARRILGAVAQADQVQHVDRLVTRQALENLPGLATGVDIGLAHQGVLLGSSACDMRTLTGRRGLTTYAAVCPKGVPAHEPRPVARLHRRAGARGRDRVAGRGRRRGRRGGGRGLLQHCHDRLSGDPDRPVLHGPDRGLHLPACGQHRNHRRRPGTDVRFGGDRRQGRDFPRPADRAGQLARRR